ncbi:MAG: NADAR family protein [Clostridium sp.]
MKYSVSMIINKFDKKEILKYVFFYRNTPSSDGSITKTCFSQWWQGNFIVNEKEYCCMEQYMMAEKARLFNDKEIEEEIMECKYPKRIKALGRMVRNFNEDVWNDNKYDIVLRGNYAKFSQDEELKKFIINTKNRVLVEASPYDSVWGIKMSSKDNNIENPHCWRGENLLGFALMEVRDKLIEESI